MKIVCGGDVTFGKEAFSSLGRVEVLETAEMRRSKLADADALVVRSTVKVGRDLLDGCSVRFVGTATIGFDHMDVAWLEKTGIRWCHAAGCNATSVAEYVIAALLEMAVRRSFSLEGRTIGVIGVGNVGSRVVEKCQALGMAVLRNDPPLERKLRLEGSSEASLFMPLDKVLAESDIITLHVPLEKDGQCPTWRMVNRSFLDRMKDGAILINSARGSVVNTDDLVEYFRKGKISDAVIDTWEGEPAFRLDLLEKISIGSPHIAGYSFDGKVAGTAIVYSEACRWAGVSKSWSPDPLLPPPEVPSVAIQTGGKRDEEVLREVVSKVYDINVDDRSMRELAADPKCRDPEERSRRFAALRRYYRMRREFRFTTVSADTAGKNLLSKLRGLGFQLAGQQSCKGT